MRGGVKSALYRRKRLGPVAVLTGMRELIIAALASAACGAGHGTSTTGISDKGGGGPGPMSAPGGGGGIGSPGSGGTPVPGQLTAGDWDDNLNFEFFKLYLHGERNHRRTRGAGRD